MGRPQIIIDGTWLSSLMSWGDLEWVNSWPGGTESITFGVARSHRLFRPDAIVELDVGGFRSEVGTLVEPTRGEPLVVEGLHRKAEDEPALDSLGNVSTDVNDATDQAIGRGLPWAGRADLSPSSATLADILELDQPHSLAQYLDAVAQERSDIPTGGIGWGVGSDRRAFMAGWLPVDLHILPGLDGLAISRDGYASTLHGRYLDVATSTYKTVTAHDEVARKRWGRVPRTITAPLGEGVPMSATQAQSLIDGLLAQGRSQIGWASPLEVQFGDVVNKWGHAVDLNTIRSRRTVRVHGLQDDIADLSGQTWVDVPIARVRRSSTGSAVLEPRGLSSPMNDALAGVS